MYLTFVTFNMIKLVVFEVRTVHGIVELCNHELFARCCLHFVHWLYVIRHFAIAMNGNLVVTTKENINQNPRMFPSVVTYLLRYKTMCFYWALNMHLIQVQLKHRDDTLLHVLRPSWFIFCKFHAFEL